MQIEYYGVRRGRLINLCFTHAVRAVVRGETVDTDIVNDTPFSSECEDCKEED